MDTNFNAQHMALETLKGANRNLVQALSWMEAVSEYLGGRGEADVENLREILSHMQEEEERLRNGG